MVYFDILHVVNFVEKIQCAKGDEKSLDVEVFDGADYC